MPKDHKKEAKLKRQVDGSKEKDKTRLDTQGRAS